MSRHGEAEPPSVDATAAVRRFYETYPYPPPVDGLDHYQRMWQEPFVPLRLPKMFNLRSDPFEKAHEEGIGYPRWRIDRTFLLVPAQQYIGQFLGTFKEFPPSQKVGSFSLDQVMEALSSGMTGGR